MKKILFPTLIAIALISSVSAQTLVYQTSRKIVHPSQTRPTETEKGYIVIESAKTINSSNGDISKNSYIEIIFDRYGSKKYRADTVVADATNGWVASIVRLGANIKYLASDGFHDNSFDETAISGNPSWIKVKNYGSVFIPSILTQSWSVWYPYYPESRQFGDPSATAIKPLVVSLSKSTMTYTLDLITTPNVVNMDLPNASEWIINYLSNKGYSSY